MGPFSQIRGASTDAHGVTQTVAVPSPSVDVEAHLGLMKRRLSLLEQAYSQSGAGPYLLGSEPSVTDYFTLHLLIVISEAYDAVLPHRLQSLLEAMTARPRVQAYIAERSPKPYSGSPAEQDVLALLTTRALQIDP